MSEPWSGALGPRKKADLLDLAGQLGLPVDSSATKPEIVETIKTYIESNESVLIEDPRFKGLYGRKPANRKGSILHQEDFSDSTIAAAIVDRKPTSRVVRSSRISLSESPVRNTEATLPVTPSRIALPASPARMLSNAVARIRPEVDGVVANVHRAAEQLEVEKDKALATTKRFMSSSPNIAMLSVLWELLVLLYAYIPLVTRDVTFTPPGSSAPMTLGIPYPPASVFLSKDTYALISQWAVPTLVLPVIFGNLISFQTQKDVDPISAGIVRLACAVSWSWGVSEDLLSTKTRVVSAALALSFAVAEKLSQPQSTPESKISNGPSSRPSRRLLTAA